MKVVRGQVSSMIDVDFFLTEADQNAKYEDDRIAEIIKGCVYQRTKQRINDFIARCEQTLAGLQDRVNQTESEFSSLVARAKAEQPGSGPSGIFLDKSNPNSVARYNEKVERHNAQVELHRRIVDQANRAKERYEDAVAKFNEKKAELEEQIREKLEELKPALDQDILTLLGKMEQLAYDNIKNKNNLFAAFLLSYMTKKAYVFLYDRIDSTTEQRAATEIFKKLNDELDSIISGSGHEVKDGLKQAAQYLGTCFHENETLLKTTEENLQRLPYQQCTDNEGETQRLLSLPIETSFQYKDIIDPAELAKVEEQVQKRKADFEQQVGTVDTFTSKMNPTFDAILNIKTFVEDRLVRMKQNKTDMLDPIFKDLMFTLGVFNEEDQERYLKKHIQWFRELHKEVNQAISTDVAELARKTIDTDLLTKPTAELLNTNAALLFLSHKERLAQKKQQFLDGIKALDSNLAEINELPREKSEECQKKMSNLLNVSILPLGNVGVLYSIIALIKQFLPALTSRNSFYVQLKETLAKKFQVFLYIHASLTVISGVGSFLVEASTQAVLWFVTFTYVVSTVVIYLKGSELKKI